ncbi:MAG: hydantoinase B/oxoprolinase family protein [Ktedonobacteraceae bacterium]
MPLPTAEQKLTWMKVEPPTPEEQAAVNKLRPGDYEVGFQRTNDILDESLEVFQRSCRSSMGVAGDVIVAMFTAQGDLVNCSAGTYLHAIIQPIMIKYILKYYSQNPGVRDGDIWFANDALYGGIHNPDMVVILPVFHHGRLIAWCGAANHTTETGAIEPGGMSVTASARFTEGMNLPPVKLGENGVLREDWIEIFNAYGMRAPQMMITDLKARSTAADRTRTRLLELAEKEGTDFVIGLMRKMLMVAEAGARKRIAGWPDGKFRCVAFSDASGGDLGLIRSASLTVEKKGDHLFLDFTGTSPENMSSYNAHVQAAVGHLANYIYSYIFHDLPISSASFVPIDCYFPPGSVLNPDNRAATSCSVMICTGIMSAAPNSFAKMIFGTQDHTRVVAASANAGNAMVVAGLSQWGLPFADMLAYSLNTDGQGGRPTSPGMDASHFAWCPFGRSPDVESMENEFPMLLPISQHWQDSCGHGANRGGSGTAQMWVAHQVPMVFFQSIADNSKVQTSQPLFGGYSPCVVPGISIHGADILQRMKAGDNTLELDLPSLLTKEDISGEWLNEPFIRSVRPYSEGDVISYGFSTGGAGYGDALCADPQQVVQDVEAKIISDWSARTIYKVAYDSTQMRVNQEETKALREAERKARLARGKPWDTFMEEWSQLKPPDEALKWFGSWPEGAVTAPVFRP